MILLLPWIPILAAVSLLFIPKEKEALLRLINIVACSASAIITLACFVQYDIAKAGFQFVTESAWLPALNISYKVGFDGINLTLCLLHALVSLAASFVVCNTKERSKEYLFYYLLLVGAIYGVFTSLDMFFLYVFYEMTLIPLFPMIGIWGSKEKSYGAMKLTLFITTGAVVAFFGLLLLYQQLGTFDLIALTTEVKRLGLGLSLQKFLAPFLLLGFGVMASIWPLHSWSPIGYACAPTAVSMLHAGVLKKMGPYFILRVAVGLLPAGTLFWSPWLAMLAGIGIFYAGMAAIKQKDLKFMVGFSSVSHMGYVLLGIATMNVIGISGTVLLIFSHGVMAACTFACIGFLYERTHARDIDSFGGLVKKMPFIGICFIMASMASLGLPGFSNFVSEVLVFIGAWQQYPEIVAIAVLGILITAIYLLRAVRHVCYGEFNPQWESLQDAKGFVEKFPFILLLGALLLFGCWPQGILRVIEPSVRLLLP